MESKMSASDFFPERPDVQPIIYAYCEPHNRELKGLLKVGYTGRTIEERMHEHYPTLKPGEKPYEVVFTAPRHARRRHRVSGPRGARQPRGERLQAPARPRREEDRVVPAAPWTT
jgi:hypothetical protein